LSAKAKSEGRTAMKLKNMLTATAAVAGALCLIGGEASATVWTADFSTSTLDPSLTFYGDPGMSYASGGGTLQLSYSTAGSTTPVIANGGVQTNFSVDGTWSMRVTENISSVGTSIYPNLFVGGEPLFKNSNALGGVTPYVTPQGNFYQGNFTVNGVYVGGSSQPLGSNVVTLQYQRVGDSIVESIAPGNMGNFTIVDSASGAEFLGQTQFILPNYYQGTLPVSNSTPSYSNFSVTYGSDPSLPQSITDLVGGMSNAPAPLPTGSIGSVSGLIAGIGTQDFYRFHWNGGEFSTDGSVVGANPLASYQLELLNPDGSINQNLTIDNGNSFMANIDEFLSAGDYTIGVANTSPYDPQYFIDFLTPVSGTVPEPATWAMMLAGLGGSGAMMRSARRKGSLTLAAA
jgi:hypothetical protein